MNRADKTLQWWGETRPTQELGAGRQHPRDRNCPKKFVMALCQEQHALEDDREDNQHQLNVAIIVQKSRIE